MAYKTTDNLINTFLKNISDQKKNHLLQSRQTMN